MKILKLHFKNLNSLVGEWEIDFTNPEYSEQGIFAITGPTGAGKSTILDAICLALFGRTPRLDKINSSQNEIMSRQSGECFASLEFKTAHGHYRTWWSQSRARKKADGKLQNAQHVIEDYTNNKILEDKLSKTLQVVTDVTGMDFEHFTRAMLLAQGSFAKFLQSSADERSPILENITGTEIYTQISKLVHERKNSEENILNTLNAQLSGIRILDHQDIILLQTELAQLETKTTELLGQKGIIEKQQLWLTTIDKLRSEVQKLILAKQELEQLQHNFSHDATRLKVAKHAQEIYSDIYINLLNIRKQRTELQQNINYNQQQLPEITANLTTQQNRVKQAHEKLNSYKINHQQNQQLWQEVRLLDAEIANKQQQLAAQNIKLKQDQDELTALVNNNTQLTLQEQSEQQQLDLVTNYLQQHHADEKLISDYSGICGNLDRLATIYLQIEDLQAKERNYHQQILVIQHSITTLDSQNHDLNSEHQQTQQQISQQEQHRQNIAGDKTIAMLQDDMLQQTKIQANYRELNNQIVQNLALEEQLTEIDNKINAEQQTIAKETPELGTTDELITITTQLVDNLIAQELLQSKISDLSDKRNELHENQPCPLCGSLEHPYVKNLPISSNLATQILDARSTIKVLQNQQLKLHTILATSQANLTKLSEQREELITRQTILMEQIKSKLTTYAMKPEEVNNRLSQLELHIEQIQSQIVQLQEIEQQLATLNQKQQDSQHKLTNLKIQHSELVAQKQGLESYLAEITTNIRVTSNEYQHLTEMMKQQLRAYQITDITHEQISAIKDQLYTRLTSWQNQQYQAQQSKQNLQQIAHEIKQNQEVSATISKQVNLQQSAINLLNTNLNQIIAKRREMFADNDVAKTEQLWQQRLIQIEQDTKQQESRLQQLEQQHITLNTLINKELAQLTTLNGNLQNIEQDFNQHLISASFINEEDFNAKRLTRDEINNLQRQQDHLTQESITLESRIQQTNQQLAHEESLQLSTQTISELQVMLHTLQENYDSCNQRIGEIRGQLSANSQAQEQQQDTIAKRDRQLQITERYRRLHMLIGSSDGKKFRNFAQGLTFELVVKHANQQLRQMSDRYLLIRDNNAPLELNVIDNYQGGEIRSTKNLSGGESFVISLALALGLSKLSSNKVQVDSLFLDEGFGTLDEDALQTALDALDSLQRDGKLIGVISHVGALKDRISLQIQVEPLSGGVSRISGVGCGRK